MKTKIYLPQNIFSRLLLSEIEDTSKLEVEFLPSSIIVKEIDSQSDSVGLIPALDLLTNKDLFVSSEIGISFNALLSNSYIHFKEEQETIDQLFMKGDITANEVILSKIMFKEFYDVDVKTTLLNKEISSFNDNILISGDENFEKELFLNGLSFSEEVIELIDAPYVNYVLASTSEDSLNNFNNNYKVNFENGHPENFSKLFPKFPEGSLDFLSVNIQHLVFDLEEQDREGLNLLLQMPYYHGLIKEMFEVKFV